MSVLALRRVRFLNLAATQEWSSILLSPSVASAKFPQASLPDEQGTQIGAEVGRGVR